MNDIILTILECIVTIGVIIVVRYIVPEIQSRIGSSNYEMLVSFVESVVYAMQQTLTDNTEKKTTAVELVTDWVNEHGIEITEEQIDILIEAAVKELKILEQSSSN